MMYMSYFLYFFIKLFKYFLYSLTLLFIMDVGEMGSNSFIDSEEKFKNKFELIVNQTSDLISVTTFSLNPVYTYVSPSNMKAFGYTTDELIGRSGFDFIHPDDKHRLFPLLKKYIKLKAERFFSNKEPDFVEEIEFRFKDKYGIWHQLQSTVNIINDELLFVSKDITDQQKIEKALRKSEKQYRFLFETIPNGIGIAHFDGRIVKVNTNFCDILGYTKEEFYKTNIRDLYVCPTQRDHLFQILEKNGFIRDFEIQLWKKDGSVCDFLVNCDVITFEGNKALLTTGRDITEKNKIEAKYRLFADHSADIIYTYNLANEMYTFISPAIEKLLGYTPKEGYDLKPEDLLTEESHHFQKNKLQEALQKKQYSDATLELQTVHKNGTIIPVEAHLSFVFNDQQDPVEVVGVVREITERKKAEMELHHNEKFLNDVFDSIGDGISVLDKELTILRTNPFMDNLYNTQLPLAGKKCYQVYQNRSSPCPWCPSLKAMDTKKTQFSVVAYPSNDNPEGWVNLSAYPLIDENGEVYGVIEYVKDVTTEKSLEQKLKNINHSLEQRVDERTKEIQKLLRQKDCFINQLGHDLKHPLGPFINLIPLLEKNDSNPDHKEMYAVLKRNTDHMRNIVSKLIRLAQLNAPSFNLSIDETDLLAELDRSIEVYNTVIQKRGVTLLKKCTPPVIIKADKILIRELFDNLISNALKYSYDNGTIIVTVEQDESFITVSVSDDGVGLTKEHIDSIFNEFFKADESRHDFESSGLGMTIAKRIVEKHGGKIWAESEGLGKGSTFYVTLPIYRH